VAPELAESFGNFASRFRELFGAESDQRHKANNQYLVGREIHNNEARSCGALGDGVEDD
jgi:hypothetical protein